MLSPYFFHMPGHLDCNSSQWEHFLPLQDQSSWTEWRRAWRQGRNRHPRCCREGCWWYLSKLVSSFGSEQRRSGSGRERWPPTWSIIPSFHTLTSILLSPMTFLISQIQLAIFSPPSSFRLVSGLTAGRQVHL